MSTSQTFSEEDIKNFLEQPLPQITPPWEYFPDHGKELFYLVTIMPRQLFELPKNKASQADHRVQRKTSDETLRLVWNVNCLFTDETNASTPELFYKIETLLIRSLIKANYSNLKRCLPLGTLSEIADRINFDSPNLEKIKEALYFGSAIRISLSIGKSKEKAEEGIRGKSNQRKENHQKNENQSLKFSLFNLALVPIASASSRQQNKNDKNNGNYQKGNGNPAFTVNSKNKGAAVDSHSLTEESFVQESLTDDDSFSSGKEMIYLFPTSAYAEILNAKLNSDETG